MSNNSQRFTGKMHITYDEIMDVLTEYIYQLDCAIISNNNSNNEFENKVSNKLMNRIPQEKVSPEDFILYTGTISSLIWMNRKSFMDNSLTPERITVQQNPQGSFKSWIC
tara:strand:- start:4834 stop:5163 length:330 start_codon:yes stop_codon:yes gene_type:complete